MTVSKFELEIKLLLYIGLFRLPKRYLTIYRILNKYIIQLPVSIIAPLPFHSKIMQEIGYCFTVEWHYSHHMKVVPKFWRLTNSSVLTNIPRPNLISNYFKTVKSFLTGKSLIHFREHVLPFCVPLNIRRPIQNQTINFRLVLFRVTTTTTHFMPFFLISNNG